jgi:tetratricopeptide (TPR) repeat protein
MVRANSQHEAVMPDRDELLNLAALVAISLSVFVAYSPAMHGELIWDDSAHVTKPELVTWRGLYRIWSEPGATQQYYPLLHSAFWIEYQFWGTTTYPYHIVNICEHIASVWILFLILSKLQIRGAILAAALFGIHPVMVESVAWISEQKNTLSTVFYLGAALVYLRFDEARLRASYIGASVLFLLALLTKSVTATLPVALLVIFWWRRGSLSWRRDIVPLLPWFAVGIVAGLCTAWVERTYIGAEGSDFQLTLVQRGLLAGRIIWFYLAKLFWPAHLIFIYPRWKVDASIWWQWLFPLAALLVTIVLWILRNRWRAPLAGWLFFAGTLFPVLGFFNVFPFVFSYVADHFQYLASLGIIVPFSAGAVLAMRYWAQLSSRNRDSQLPQWICYGLSTLLVGALAALTWQQSHSYSDIVTLYETTIDKNPACWMAYNNLGALYIRRGHPQEAIEPLQTATTIKPDYGDAFNNLGLAYTAMNKHEEAVQHYREAVRIDGKNPEFHNNLGIALGNMNNPREAAEQFRAALDANPEFVKARTNLGSAYTQLHEPERALEQLQLALASNPDFAFGHMNLAIAYEQLGKSDEAISEAELALSLARKQGQIELAQRITNWLAKYNAASHVPLR